MLVNLSIADGDVLVRTPYALKELCQNLPMRKWDAGLKVWRCPASPVIAQKILDVFAGHKIENDAAFNNLLDHRSKEIEQRQQLESFRNLPPIPVEKTPSWAHQRAAFWFAENKTGVMLALEMGCGKSKVTIDLLNHWDCKRVLIVCPKSVIDVWPKQFATHSCHDWEILTLGKSNQNTAEKARRALRFLERTSGKPSVIVINYDSAREDSFKDFACKEKWNCLIMDESHRIKSPGGKSSKAMFTISQRAARRIGLTGTPMPHSPLDIYAQFRAIDPSVFGTSFQAFSNRYAIKGGYCVGGRPVQVIGYQNQDEMRDLFESVAFKVSREVLDLPPTHHITVDVELEKETLKIYKELEKELIVEIENGTCVANNALVKLLRLQQITGGCLPFVNDETGEKMAERIGTEKADALHELLEDLPENEPVVVFARFRMDLAQIHEVATKLGRKSLELSGQRNELADWQNGEAPILAVQIQSGGVGIDLTRAAYCVYYSLGFSLGDYEQSLARTHRPGQTRSVTYYHLVASGTVDQKVYTALKHRKDVVLSILDRTT